MDQVQNESTNQAHLNEIQDLKNQKDSLIEMNHVLTQLLQKSQQKMLQLNEKLEELSTYGKENLKLKQLIAGLQKELKQKKNDLENQIYQNRLAQHVWNNNQAHDKNFEEEMEEEKEEEMKEQMKEGHRIFSNFWNFQRQNIRNPQLKNIKFSQEHKSNNIILKDNELTTIYIGRSGESSLAFLNRPVNRGGDSVYFKILQSVKFLAVGLGFTNINRMKGYSKGNGLNLGHGCFVVSNGGYKYSHSFEEQNFAGRKREGREKDKPFFEAGDVARVQIYVDELIVTVTKKNGFEQMLKLKLQKMNDHQWEQARFCVELSHPQDSVQIVQW